VAFVCRKRLLDCADPNAPSPPDGAAPAIDMNDPLNAATAAYIEASCHEPDGAAKVEEMRRMSSDKGPETSALFHKMAEAKATDNQVLEGSLRMAARYSPTITEEDETIWEEIAEHFVDLFRFFKKPVYRSWEKEGKGDINYSTIEWRLPADGTVALIADWGTGRSDAIEVLKWACSFDPDAIIHLGDIYVAATQDECQDNFLRPIRMHARNSTTGRPIPVFNMAGNHDYYSGGHGFHWLLDQLNTGDQAQPASYFALRSADDGWQFLAMDTGFESRKEIFFAHSQGSAPREDEIPWIQHKLGMFSGRTILLSHHQAFSNHDRLGGDPDEPTGKDSINQRLLSITRPYFDKIAGWFWGHEHNLVIFKEFMGLAKGRCVGHGARPIRSSSFIDIAAPPTPIEQIKLGLSADGEHYNHGFEIIQLHGAGKPADVTYYEVMLNEAGDESVVREIYREKMK
jgi:3',5'-cyclic AMP phosphodiesterase CpdA